MVNKSVDVGSMFLMDLSDSNETDEQQLIDENDKELEACVESRENYEKVSPRGEGTTSRPSQPQLSSHIDRHINLDQQAYHSPLAQKNAICRLNRRVYENNSIDDSLRRIADALESEDEDENITNKDVQGSLTIVEPSTDFIDHQLALSLSDVSFVTGSDDSISASYNAISENEDIESASADTNREDSGVIDVKDLEYLLNNPSNSDREDKSHLNNHRNKQEKTISSINIEVTNLINEPVEKLYRGPDRLKQPTNIKKSNMNSDISNWHESIHHYNYQQQHRNHAKRRLMSASLPIKVPARQMKDGLNKLKLGLIKDDPDCDCEVAHGCIRTRATKRTLSPNKSSAEDVDDFLEQEYNENHNNHYSNDDIDEEPPRAEDDPMRLFESIQALARSLHKDTELFGSLPPKRLLSSPLRSLTMA